MTITVLLAQINSEKELSFFIKYKVLCQNIKSTLLTCVYLITYKDCTNIVFLAIFHEYFTNRKREINCRVVSRNSSIFKMYICTWTIRNGPKLWHRRRYRSRYAAVRNSAHFPYTFFQTISLHRKTIIR